MWLAIYRVFLKMGITTIVAYIAFFFFSLIMIGARFVVGLSTKVIDLRPRIIERDGYPPSPRDGSKSYLPLPT